MHIMKREVTKAGIKSLVRNWEKPTEMAKIFSIPCTTMNIRHRPSGILRNSIRV